MPCVNWPRFGLRAPTVEAVAVKQFRQHRWASCLCRQPLCRYCRRVIRLCRPPLRRRRITALVADMGYPQPPIDLTFRTELPAEVVPSSASSRSSRTCWPFSIGWGRIPPPLRRRHRPRWKWTATGLKSIIAYRNRAGRLAAEPHTGPGPEALDATGRGTGGGAMKKL
ncbi:MAG: hypothetical protein R3A10_01635 [Caldilineaceae bacterium]